MNRTRHETNSSTNSIEGIKEKYEVNEGEAKREFEYEKKTIRDARAGLHIFDKVKRGVLRETRETLEACQDEFYDLSTELVEDHELAIGECTDKMDKLNRLIKEELEHIQQSEAELLAVAVGQDMRQELAWFVNGFVQSELRKKETEYGQVHDRIALTQDDITSLCRKLKDELRFMKPNELKTRAGKI